MLMQHTVCGKTKHYNPCFNCIELPPDRSKRLIVQGLQLLLLLLLLSVLIETCRNKDEFAQIGAQSHHGHQCRKYNWVKDRSRPKRGTFLQCGQCPPEASVHAFIRDSRRLIYWKIEAWPLMRQKESKRCAQRAELEDIRFVSRPCFSRSLSFSVPGQSPSLPVPLYQSVPISGWNALLTFALLATKAEANNTMH